MMMPSSGAPFEAPSDADGYISPEFDLPTDGDDDDEGPPSKKARKPLILLDEEEELALRLLGRS